jgi:hypothetical protein
MVPRWVVVDKMVHELGSLRAVVQEVEARPDLADDDVAHELRRSLARAADIIHLVIGGNEAMVEKAWRCIADAQDVGARVRAALARARAPQRDAGVIRPQAQAQGRRTRQNIRDPQALQDRTRGPRSPRGSETGNG